MCTRGCNTAEVYLDGAARDVEHVLGLNEDIIPKPGLLVALHLWKVEVWPCAEIAAAIALISFRDDQTCRNALQMCMLHTSMLTPSIDQNNITSANRCLVN